MNTSLQSMSSPGRADWIKYRACDTRHPDEDFWYPEGLGRRERTQAAQIAIKTCGRCIVKDQCLQTALATGERHGIWGGRDFEAQPACRLCAAVLRLYSTGCAPEAIAAELGHPASRLAGCLTRHGQWAIAKDLGWVGKKKKAAA